MRRLSCCFPWEELETKRLLLVREEASLRARKQRVLAKGELGRGALKQSAARKR